MSDYSELEEENISLQKQLLQLKQSQVDYEAMKYETKRLKEEVEDLHIEIEELAKLKNIVERNLEDALTSLENEREQKHALKKDLDQRLTSESMFNLQSLAGLNLGDLKFGVDNHTGRNNSRPLGVSADGQDISDPKLKIMEADFSSTGKETDKQGSDQSVVGDLFSEIHITEMRKLENVLESTEHEKSRLQQALEDSHSSLKQAQTDLSEQQEQISHMKAQLSAMASLTSGPEEDLVNYEEEPEEDELDNANHPEVALMKKNLRQQEKRYSAALEQINELQEQLKIVQNKVQSEQDKDAQDDLRDEAAKLRNKVIEYEETINGLKSEVNSMSLMSGESQETLNSTQDELVKVSEDLMTLYHLVCEVNGETPNRVMLEHVQGRRFRRKASPQGAEGSKRAKGEESEGSASDREKSPEKELPEPKGDPITCYKLMETVHDQIKYLRRAVERSMEVSRQRQMDSNAGEEVTELQEQVVKLKAMLSTKREQIATLRSVLKANKSTAEVALGNLKGKYENEKAIVTDTMQKLRNELKSLKEEAASFASFRAMFAQRCDEYITQLDELQRQAAAAEEEKKTLNSLLRMAIQQKLALTQRLEDLEFDRERKTMTGRRQGGPRRGGGPAKVSYHQQQQQQQQQFGGYDNQMGRFNLGFGGRFNNQQHFRGFPQKRDY